MEDRRKGRTAKGNYISREHLVKAIMQAHTNNYTFRQIAAFTGASYATVSRILDQHRKDDSDAHIERKKTLLKLWKPTPDLTPERLKELGITLARPLGQYP
jgi:hypothetical protein